MNRPAMMAILAPALMIASTQLAARRMCAQTALLSGPGDFSGEETLVTFDGLGAGFGADVPSAGGVDFVLDDGSPPRFLFALEPREFGPEGFGAIDNSFGFSAPFAGLHMLFAESIHRVGFEALVNERDTLTVSLFSGGALVDEVTLPSRGSGQFYFYGFENALGFDEVVVDAGTAVGTLSLDNLSFEPIVASARLLSCEGFESTSTIARRWMDVRSHGRRGQRQHWKELRRHMGGRLLHARLLDADGLALTDADLAAAPTVRIYFDAADGADSVDITDAVLDGREAAFRWTVDGDWWIALPRRAMRERGTYVVTMESGDESEYAIEPTCSRSIVRIARRPHHPDRD